MSLYLKSIIIQHYFVADTAQHCLAATVQIWLVGLIFTSKATYDQLLPGQCKWQQAINSS